MPLASLARLAPLALLVALAGCDTGEGPSLYDPERPTNPDPVVSSITPQGVVLAGIDEITITGSNFSATPDENLVFFGDVAAEVLAASPTELRVRAPNTPGENLEVRVAVRGATNYNAPVAYSLTPAVVPFGNLGQSDTPFGIATDPEGNLYLLRNRDGTRGIIRYTPDGSESLFFETTFEFPSLTYGPDGALYGVRGVRAVFRLPEGGAQETFAIIENRSVLLGALDADAAGNLYVGGNNGASSQSIYRIAPDQSITSYPLDGNVRAIAAYGDAVYAATTQGGTSQIFRFPADASGDLGTPTLYADVTAIAGAEATALAFADSGDLYVGTTAETDPVLLVRPDGSGDVLYPGVLSGPTVALAYGPGTKLYMRTADVLNADGSVRLVAGLVRIETRQDGAR